jgi:uncharacterized protein (DUF169 family)
MQEKRHFSRLGVENTAIFAVFCTQRSSEFRHMVFSTGSAELREIEETNMAIGNPCKVLEETMGRAVHLPHRAVAVAFLDSIPADLDKFDGTEPSGCSFWRLAASGKSFYTLPANHFNCAVGAYTHNVPLPAAREGETEQTLGMMFALGYLQPEEVPELPRLAKPPAAIAYSPLGDARFAPDVVIFACQPATAMLLLEAARRAGISSAVPAMGRPTCMALPAALESGAILSLGCIGNRSYTGLGRDELYFIVRGRDLDALARSLEVIARANEELERYALGRRAELATI